MSELDHSKRAALQASFTPVKLPRKLHEEAKTQGRALEKYGFFASLKPTLAEIAELKSRFEAPSTAIASTPVPRLDFLRAVELAIPELGTPNVFRSAPLFRGLSPDALVAFAEDLIQLRQEKLKAVIATHETLATAFQNKAAPSKAALAAPAASQAALATPARGEPPKLGPRAIMLRSEVPITEATPPASAPLSLSSPVETPPAAAVSPQAMSLGALVSWATSQNVEKERALQASNLAAQIVRNAGGLNIGEFKNAGIIIVDFYNRLVEGFKANFSVESVGYLHLERMTFMPAGIERGELLHSVPLAPGEEVNITHREWSNTSQEFERIVTDFLEAYSEQGVTEKSELTEASSSQQQHSSSLDTSASVSAEYGTFSHVNVSASLASHVADSASASEQVTRNHSSTITRKAATRITKEHKESFRVASAAGTEDQAVRRFKNPFEDKATRVDYYQLVRKWKVDLFRYGVRLTYDITIPEPGSDIIARIQEIQKIRAELDAEFGPPEPIPIHPPPGWVPPPLKPDWAVFDLRPEDITRDNYEAIGAAYNAGSLEAPRPDRLTLMQAFDKQWTDEAAQHGQQFSLEFDVPEDYFVVEDLEVQERHVNIGGKQWFSIVEGRSEWGVNGVADWHALKIEDYPPPPSSRGTGHVYLEKYTGQEKNYRKIVLNVGAVNLYSQAIQLTVGLKLRDDAYQRWQEQTWNAIREGALARYNDHREVLKEQLSRLTEELGAQDPLSLRKIEREEMMKGCVRWLLGPDLQFGPPGAGNLYNRDTQTIDPAIWADVLSHGEFIKFLHNAIEWENMVYFLYPYFWSHTASWELKKYLDHPDPIHKAFLRSGAARVVLTIRPGFERDFTSLLQLGSFFDALQTQGSNHPYITIAEEMENYAKTNYPGIRPANPVENARPLLSPKQKKAWKEVQIITAFLDLFASLHDDQYPSTLNELQSVFPARDPWGNEYFYMQATIQGLYQLVSRGADGAVGGVGENADIGGDEDISTLSASQQKAWRTLRIIRGLLDSYAVEKKGYPLTLAGLTSILSLRDPWGNDYAYTSPGEHGDYDLLSYGEDTTTNRSDEKEHITSWAEASLIGTWYEYTPTSAMDIAFDQTMPGTFEAEYGGART